MANRQTLPFSEKPVPGPPSLRAVSSTSRKPGCRPYGPEAGPGYLISRIKAGIGRSEDLCCFKKYGGHGFAGATRRQSVGKWLLVDIGKYKK